ncbi:hypothetical protein PF005_g23710 [Phytophthora fragariae]|uniref:RxLR effector protein n=1 Tax=Phytophthora fragariae TaxID=53985 RepID=A0A6A3QN22_9STRA|nr:hypothetical protein PF003_g37062 [Phytophthora fragariae]KAE8925280.1 hypothetical protein PF009_g24507 [Phytophthora fragariae]KAE8980700.1 hypothetical protein PF011_g22326 [Phytophthora fragariae]KAE9078704.1 hypothetical protein PF007_g23738 [Phytophthora fragariae]KAE9078900.1 hypothetical protein PF010_g22958 [Phytophthora fragariae]
MIKFLLLLVIALAIFDGGDAVSKIETSKLSSSNVGHAVRTDNGGKRSLRGLALINDAANEERGGTEVANKLKALAS